MKVQSRIVWSLVLLNVAGAAAKEPLWVGAAESDKSKVFIDTANVRYLNGHSLQVWVLFDFAAGQLDDSVNKLYMSSKELDRIDCEGDKYANIAWVNYTEPMGHGPAVDSQEIDERVIKYVHKVPGSVLDSVIEFVCSLKRPASAK
jgi:hypothetical protein